MFLEPLAPGTKEEGPPPPWLSLNCVNAGLTWEPLQTFINVPSQQIISTHPSLMPGLSEKVLKTSRMKGSTLHKTFLNSLSEKQVILLLLVEW